MTQDEQREYWRETKRNQRAKTAKPEKHPKDACPYCPDQERPHLKLVGSEMCGTCRRASRQIRSTEKRQGITSLRTGEARLMARVDALADYILTDDPAKKAALKTAYGFWC